jgi:hypothetical protein
MGVRTTGREWSGGDRGRKEVGGEGGRLASEKGSE